MMHAEIIWVCKTPQSGCEDSEWRDLEYPQDEMKEASILGRRQYVRFEVFNQML